MNIIEFVKEQRRIYGFTQIDLAKQAKVGLRFVRDLEQGKESLRLDKVNDVLQLFNYKVGAVPMLDSQTHSELNSDIFIIRGKKDSFDAGED